MVMVMVITSNTASGAGDREVGGCIKRSTSLRSPFLPFLLPSLSSLPSAALRLLAFLFSWPHAPHVKHVPLSCLVLSFSCLVMSFLVCSCLLERQKKRIWERHISPCYGQFNFSASKTFFEKNIKKSRKPIGTRIPGPNQKASLSGTNLSLLYTFTIFYLFFVRPHRGRPSRRESGTLYAHC